MLKNMFNFKNKTRMFYLKLSISLLVLILSLVFFIIDRVDIVNNITFTDDTTLSFVFLLIGSLLGIVDSFIESKYTSYIPIIECVLIGCGIGVHLSNYMFPMTDVRVGVPFFVSSMPLAQKYSTLFLLFLILYVICLITIIVTCFLNTKTIKDIKKEEKENLNLNN